MSETVTRYVAMKGWRDSTYLIRVDTLDAGTPMAVDIISADFRDVLRASKQHTPGSYTGRVLRDAVRRYRRRAIKDGLCEIRTGGLATASILDSLGNGRH